MRIKRSLTTITATFLIATVPLAAPAQVGLHSSSRETYGDSLIVDYWGQVLSRLARGSGVITADMDLAAQAQSRLRFPALDNRQLGLPRDVAHAAAAEA